MENILLYFKPRPTKEYNMISSYISFSIILICVHFTYFIINYLWKQHKNDTTNFKILHHLRTHYTLYKETYKFYDQKLIPKTVFCYLWKEGNLMKVWLAKKWLKSDKKYINKPKLHMRKKYTSSFKTLSIWKEMKYHKIPSACIKSDRIR